MVLLGEPITIGQLIIISCFRMGGRPCSGIIRTIPYLALRLRDDLTDYPRDCSAIKQFRSLSCYVIIVHLSYRAILSRLSCIDPLVFGCSPAIMSSLSPDVVNDTVPNARPAVTSQGTSATLPPYDQSESIRPPTYSSPASSSGINGYNNISFC